MPTSVVEIMSTLLPADGQQRTDLVIEQFDQWYNPSANPDSTVTACGNPSLSSCLCGNPSLTPTTSGDTADEADDGE